MGEVNSVDIAGNCYCLVLEKVLYLDPNGILSILKEDKMATSLI